MNLMKRNNKAISAGHPLGTKMSKSPKSMMKESREQLCSEMERKGQIADESKVGGKRDTMLSGALHMLKHGRSIHEALNFLTIVLKDFNFQVLAQVEVDGR